MAYIIKPDKLFEKHKANMAIGKFSYEIQLVSLETLFREVDPSQLTSELEVSEVPSGSVHCFVSYFKRNLAKPWLYFEIRSPMKDQIETVI